MKLGSLTSEWQFGSNPFLESVPGNALVCTNSDVLMVAINRHVGDYSREVGQRPVTARHANLT